VLDLVRTNRLKPTDKNCHLYAGTSNVLRVPCIGEKCVRFVRFPIRRYEVGGAESHTWCGCIDVLVCLAKVAKVSDVPLDTLLSLNR
jgi:hypothetical protein